MVKYSCERCGKEFSQKGHYESHINRQIPCQNTLDKIKLLVEREVNEKLAKLNKPEQIHRFTDLFCGIGSFHYSFKQFGWICVQACDINTNCRDTYKKNYNFTPENDITNIKDSDIKHTDILCAGFPCQPFSQVGKGKGFEDERGTLFFQIIRFIKHGNPKIVILENVRALLTHDNGNTFNRMKKELENINYTVYYDVLTCSDYGIPQKRKRLFMVAVQKDISEKMKNIFKLDKYKKEMSLSTFFNKKFEKTHAFTLRCGGRMSAIDNRHNWDGYIVDGNEYRLSIEDGKLLQGFENFTLEGSVQAQWKQLGNTIPTIFTKMIGEQIHLLLTSDV